MKDKDKLDEMAKKYKEEMMRLYSRASAKCEAAAEEKPVSREEAPLPAAEEAMEKHAAENYEPAEEKREARAPEPAEASKFPSPDKILEEEGILAGEEKACSAEKSAEDDRVQGNYSFPPDEETVSGSGLEPLYSGDGSEGKLTGQGYLKAEVTTGGGAVPIEGATVLITKKSGRGVSLVKMLVTDRNGETETVPLPAPDAGSSETPDPSEKPFSVYELGVAAEGFYLVPEISVPVFSTVKSIQPVSLVPLAEFDERGSTDPSCAAQ